VLSEERSASHFRCPRVEQILSRSGNVNEEECVSGRRLIHTLDFYCQVNDVFRLGFLTSFGDQVLTTIIADESFIGAESRDRGQRIFRQFSSF
jgi:hypothetical protein